MNEFLIFIMVLFHPSPESEGIKIPFTMKPAIYNTAKECELENINKVKKYLQEFSSQERLIAPRATIFVICKPNGIPT
jgi:hypothetical protein